MSPSQVFVRETQRSTAGSESGLEPVREASVGASADQLDVASSMAVIGLGDGEVGGMSSSPLGTDFLLCSRLRWIQHVSFPIR